MEIAIGVFFVAILGGAALLTVVLLVYKLIRKRRR